jgi:16S rRNA (guanine(966)-N(2))-methyltransferase RsmD
MRLADEDWRTQFECGDNEPMRVIAGTYRSRNLAAPRGAKTRPTSDRLRETLFNILAPRIAGARFVDLYAGTGAVGIEALSRGAEHAYFAERAAPAVAVIRRNLNALGITTSYTLEPHGSASLLDQLARGAVPVDIVFLDPPWEAEAEYAATLDFLGSVRAAAVLAPHALVIAEHSSRNKLPDRYGRLLQTRTLVQGDAALSFYGVEVD